MDRIKKYDKYCELESDLDSKNHEVKVLTEKLEKAKYEKRFIENEIKGYADMKNLSESDLALIRNSRLRECLSKPFLFSDGGLTGGESPVVAFDKDKAEGIGSLSKEQLALYKKIKPSLEYQQFNLQNALSVAEVEDESFDVRDSVIIDDFIDEFIRNIDEDDKYTVPQLKETKKIMYIFVEYIQKFN